MNLIRVSRYQRITIKVEAVMLFKSLYLSGLPVRSMLVSAWLCNARDAK